jgi:F0F1-type ATP synthase assembly protein I
MPEKRLRRGTKVAASLVLLPVPYCLLAGVIMRYEAHRTSDSAQFLAGAAVKLALTLLLVNPYNQCLSLGLEE